MSAGAVVLIFILGFVVVTVALACLWAVVDNRWFYRRRASTGDEDGGGTARDPRREPTRRIR